MVILIFIDEWQLSMTCKERSEREGDIERKTREKKDEERRNECKEREVRLCNISWLD